MVSTDKLTELERIVGSLSSELAIAEAGTDRGLVPMFSLFGDLDDAISEDELASERANQIREMLDEILDSGAMLEAPSIEILNSFVEQLQCFLRYYRMDTPISWEAMEASWSDTIESVGPAESASPSQGAEEATSQMPQSGPGGEGDVLMVLDLEDSRDVLEEFHQEAIEHLDSIEAALLELEDDPHNKDAISSIFRSFHTIKGVAGFLELTPIRVLAHEVETLLDLVRSDRLSLGESLVSLVL